MRGKRRAWKNSPPHRVPSLPSLRIPSLPQIVLGVAYIVDALTAGIQLMACCQQNPLVTKAGLFFHALLFPLMALVCFELFYMVCA